MIDKLFLTPREAAGVLGIIRYEARKAGAAPVVLCELSGGELDVRDVELDITPESELWRVKLQEGSVSGRPMLFEVGSWRVA
jgi:hypothetical protein